MEPLASSLIDDDEVIDFRKKLKQWREIGEKQVLSILRTLSEYDMPKEQIKRTKISQVLVWITQEKGDSPEEAEIIKLCDSIIANMKKKFEKLKEEEKNNTNNTPKPQKTKAPKLQKVIKDDEIKAFSSDKTREGLCMNLKKILEEEQKAQNMERNEENLRNTVAEIEEELFKKNKCKVDGKYREDARTLISNIKVAQNSDLRVKVILGEITPSTLAECDPLILQNKLSQESGKKILNESLEKSQLDWDKEKRLKSAVSGGVKCINRKCGSDKTMTTTAQIRSADEAMTEFHECLVCGKRWKH